jgi:hypothetical protein
MKNKALFTKLMVKAKKDLEEATTEKEKVRLKKVIQKLKDEFKKDEEKK